MDLLKKVENLIAKEQNDELDYLNQLRFAGVPAAYVALPPQSLGLELPVPS